MKRIENDDIVHICKAFAKIFEDHEPFDFFFPRDKKQLKHILYFFRHEIYTAADYTYTSDDGLGLAAIKGPGDKQRDPADLWRNPIFLLRFLANTPKESRITAQHYLEYVDLVASRHYNPETDYYIEYIGVMPQARGQGRLRKMIDEICGDAPIYLETHDESNYNIYSHLGFELVEKSDFFGLPFYAMRRPAKTAPKITPENAEFILKTLAATAILTQGLQIQSDAV